MSTPLYRTVPRCGAVSPMIDRKVVVLPTPLRPKRATHSPVSTISDTPNRICERPYALCRSLTSSVMCDLWREPDFRPPRTDQIRPSCHLSQVDPLHISVGLHLSWCALGQHSTLVHHGDPLG